jgi:hypothetical protein
LRIIVPIFTISKPSKMKKLALTLLTLCLGVTFVSGQKFMPEFEQQWGRITYVIKNDDSKVWGKSTSGVVGPNGMMALTLKDTVTGEKTKLKIKDIKEVGISSKGGLGKIETMSSALESAGSISEMARTDYKSVLNADFYIYRRVVDKKGKPRILQLLNPGFEDKMQVYADPKAKENSGSGLMNTMSAGQAESYYVTKSGNSHGIYVRNKNYKKEMGLVFDDCPAIMQQFKPKFSEFASHVFYYENECK